MNYFIQHISHVAIPLMSLALVACTNEDGGNTGDSGADLTQQSVSHAVLNGIWETGCIVGAGDTGSAFSITDVYLDGNRTSTRTLYSDALCLNVSSIEAASIATYTLGADVGVDSSVTGVSVASRIDFVDSTALPSFTLIAIKSETVNELYIGDTDRPEADGSTSEKRATQLKPAFSGIQHNRLAEVVSVDFSGVEFAYTVNVGVLSPETGCNQYADWWELVSESGELIYRRILVHSHIDEQPFVRSGESVNISSDQVVIVRAHMNAHMDNDNFGYGVKAYKGSIDTGFTVFETAENFAADLAATEPFPDSCLF